METSQQPLLPAATIPEYLRKCGICKAYKAPADFKLSEDPSQCDQCWKDRNLRRKRAEAEQARLLKDDRKRKEVLHRLLMNMSGTKQSETYLVRLRNEVTRLFGGVEGLAAYWHRMITEYAKKGSPQQLNFFKTMVELGRVTHTQERDQADLSRLTNEELRHLAVDYIDEALEKSTEERYLIQQTADPADTIPATEHQEPDNAV